MIVYIHRLALVDVFWMYLYCVMCAREHSGSLLQKKCDVKERDGIGADWKGGREM